jgi:ribosome biogenesis GTPase
MPPFVSDPVLIELGFDDFFAQQLLARSVESSGSAGLVPERVAGEERGEYRLLGSNGSRRAMLAGHCRHELDPSAWPGVGDWVLAETAGDVARIEHIFERKSAFLRKAVGRAARPQTVAANVDVTLIVNALSSAQDDEHAARHALNARRIERYLLAAREAPTRAVIVINKADLPPEPEASARAAAALGAELGSADVVLVSAHSGLGFDALRERVGRGETAVLVGSSGVGKSSLVNRWLGRPAQRVSAVREGDLRGRHTTTTRELLLLPGGGVLIDTPGMRELALWAEGESATSRTSFEDIAELSQSCRYGDCGHTTEPGCAVRAAVAAGQLSPERVASALKLRRELEQRRLRQEPLQGRPARQRQRQGSRSLRAELERKGRKE